MRHAPHLVRLDQSSLDCIGLGSDSNSSCDKRCSALSGRLKLSGSGGTSGQIAGRVCGDFAAQPEIASDKISSAGLNFTCDSLPLGCL